MRIDGFYNREPIGLSDNPEEATFFCPCNHTFGCVDKKTNSLNNPMKLQHEKNKNSI